MKLLICGSRGWTDDAIIKKMIRASSPHVVITGHAPGADQLAELAAESLKIPVRSFPADWKKHGMAAGYIRNKAMLEETEPDLVIAFMIGETPGTRNMINLARDAKVPLLVFDAPAVVDYPPQDDPRR